MIYLYIYKYMDYHIILYICYIYLNIYGNNEENFLIYIENFNYKIKVLISKKRFQWLMLLI